MCILFLFVNPNPTGKGFQIVLANNRDEFYERPSKPADFWDEDEICFGGLDMFKGREGGTWLGVSKKGRIGTLLNILEDSGPKHTKGRGYLVRQFLESDVDCMHYLRQLSLEKDSYKGFNIVLLEKGSDKTWRTWLYSNKDNKEPATLDVGFLALSNSTVGEPFHKVKRGMDRFKNIITSGERNKRKLTEELLNMLSDESSHWPDPTLEKMGQHLHGDIVRDISAINMKSHLWRCGTRTKTVILIDEENLCTYVEETMREPIDISHLDCPGTGWETSVREFTIL